MTITLDGAEMTARLTGEIDHHTAAYMRSSIDAAFVRQKPETLVLDFSGVTFMDSSVYIIFLVLAGLNERDKRMMKLSGMQKMEGIEFR